jgi:hypothetical protein
LNKLGVVWEIYGHPEKCISLAGGFLRGSSS